MKKNKGRKFEDKVKNTINSGAVWFSPGDLQTNGKCIECKYTDKKGFRVSVDLLNKLWNKSLDMGKEPLLIIGIRRNENEVFMLSCDIGIERR